MIGEDLHSKYKNTLKLRINRSAKIEMEKELERKKEKERRDKERESKRERDKEDKSNMKIKSPSFRGGSSSGSWRTSSNGRTLRSRDYDISRVIFDDGPQKIVIPEHKTVVTPHWRIIPDYNLDDNKMAIDVITKSGDTTSSNIGEGGSSFVETSVIEEGVNGVEEGSVVINKGVEKGEGMDSENENTSDESYTNRHSKYEHKWVPVPTVGPGRTRQKKKRKSES